MRSRGKKGLHIIYTKFMSTQKFSPISKNFSPPIWINTHKKRLNKFIYFPISVLIFYLLFMSSLSPIWFISIFLLFNVSSLCVLVCVLYYYYLKLSNIYNFHWNAFSIVCYRWFFLHFIMFWSLRRKMNK